MAKATEITVEVIRRFADALPLLLSAAAAFDGGWRGLSLSVSPLAPATSRAACHDPLSCNTDTRPSAPNSN